MLRAYGGRLFEVERHVDHPAMPRHDPADGGVEDGVGADQRAGVRDSGAGAELLPADILFIENVGNLICPTTYDLGEDFKVVLLSVTEGDDKPVKYPAIFARAEVAVITKSDLLPHVPFELDSVQKQIGSLNPAGTVVVTSSLAGEGLEDWLGLLRERLQAKRQFRG